MWGEKEGLDLKASDWFSSVPLLWPPSGYWHSIRSSFTPKNQVQWLFIHSYAWRFTFILIFLGSTSATNKTLRNFFSTLHGKRIRENHWEKIWQECFCYTEETICNSKKERTIYLTPQTAAFPSNSAFRLVSLDPNTGVHHHSEKQPQVIRFQV